jgi:hypothetical protein
VTKCESRANFTIHIMIITHMYKPAKVWNTFKLRTWQARDISILRCYQNEREYKLYISNAYATEDTIVCDERPRRSRDQMNDVLQRCIGKKGGLRRSSTCYRSLDSDKVLMYYRVARLAELYAPPSLDSKMISYKVSGLSQIRSRHDPDLLPAFTQCSTPIIDKRSPQITLSHPLRTDRTRS